MGRDTTQIERRFQPKVLSVSKNSSMTKSLQNNLQDFHLPEKILPSSILHHFTIRLGLPDYLLMMLLYPKRGATGKKDGIDEFEKV